LDPYCPRTVGGTDPLKKIPYPYIFFDRLYDKLAHLKKAIAPIDVTEAGISSLDREVQLLNVLLLIVVIELEIVIVFSAIRLANAYAPIEVTVLGIVIAVIVVVFGSPGLKWKASSLIDVTVYVFPVSVFVTFSGMAIVASKVFSSIDPIVVVTATVIGTVVSDVTV
jgi:hypothetical protein